MENNVNSFAGKTPEGWERVKIGDIAQISAGGTPSTKKPEYWGGNVLWMNSGDLNQRIIYSVKGRITELGLKSSSAKIVPKDSVLIGLAGQGKTRGTVAVNRIELTTNQSVAFFIPENVNYKYLFYDLYRRYSELRSMSAGDGGRGGLNLQILKNLKILLPLLPEQEKIVQVLETWDTYLEKLSGAIRLKKKVKKGLMQRLLTEKTRYIGFNEEWHERKLKELGKIVTGNTPSMTKKENYGEKYLWATAQDFNGVYINDTVIKLSEEGIKVARSVPKGTILVTCIASIGKNGIANTEMSFNQQINGIIPNENFNSEFVYYLIQNSKNILKRASGAGAVPIISKSIFENIKLRFPDYAEQTAIATILTAADQEIEALEKKKALIEQQKTFLLNNLITGKLRLPEFTKVSN